MPRVWNSAGVAGAIPALRGDAAVWGSAHRSETPRGRGGAGRGGAERRGPGCPESRSPKRGPDRSGNGGGREDRGGGLGQSGERRGPVPKHSYRDPRVRDHRSGAGAVGAPRGTYGSKGSNELPAAPSSSAGAGGRLWLPRDPRGTRTVPQGPGTHWAGRAGMVGPGRAPALPSLPTFPAPPLYLAQVILTLGGRARAVDSSLVPSLGSGA